MKQKVIFNFSCALSLLLDFFVNVQLPEIWNNYGIQSTAMMQFNRILTLRFTVPNPWHVIASENAHVIHPVVCSIYPAWHSCTTAITPKKYSDTLANGDNLFRNHIC